MDETPTPKHLEDGDALDRFLETHDVAVIELYTSGCGKCQAMEPVLGNVARETGVPIGLVNPGDDLALLERFALESVPTLCCFDDGTEVGRIADGFLSTVEVVSFLETNVPEAADSS